MNILIAVHHFPPAFTGGAEWRAYRTAKSLQGRGHSVSVVCVEKIDFQTENNIDWKDEEFNDLLVRRLYFNLWAAPDIFTWKYNNPWIGENIRKNSERKKDRHTASCQWISYQQQCSRSCPSGKCKKRFCH